MFRIEWGVISTLMSVSFRYSYECLRYGIIRLKNYRNKIICQSNHKIELTKQNHLPSYKAGLDTYLLGTTIALHH